MIYIVIGSAVLVEALRAFAIGKLPDNASNNFQMGKLFRANICKKRLSPVIRHGEALGQVTQRSRKLAVRSSVLADNYAGKVRILVLDAHRDLRSFLENKHTVTSLTKRREVPVKPVPAAILPGAARSKRIEVILECRLARFTLSASLAEHLNSSCVIGMSIKIKL